MSLKQRVKKMLGYAVQPRRAKEAIELGIACPKCGKSLSVKEAKSYSLIDIVGVVFIVIFISGILFTGLFGRYTAAIFLGELYVVVFVLPKYINFKFVSKLSCENCGFSEKKIIEEN